MICLCVFVLVCNIPSLLCALSFILCPCHFLVHFSFSSFPPNDAMQELDINGKVSTQQTKKAEGGLTGCLFSCRYDREGRWQKCGRRRSEAPLLGDKVYTYAEPGVAAGAGTHAEKQSVLEKNQLVRCPCNIGTVISVVPNTRRSSAR